MKYLISDMAKLLGVTTHMLRYYEKMGIISPEVNDENHYRYYSVLDTRRFNLCRTYRSLGFTLEECVELLSWKNTDDIENLMKKQIEKQKKEVVFSKIKLGYMETELEMTPHVLKYLNKTTVLHLPDMYRLKISEKEEGKINPSVKIIRDEWLEYLPVVRWVSRIPAKLLKAPSEHEIFYDFGLMIQADYARRLQVHTGEHVEPIPGGDYLITIHKKDERVPWGWEDVTTVCEFIQKEKLTYHGDAYSTVVMSTQRDGSVENYHAMLLKVYT